MDRERQLAEENIKTLLFRYSVPAIIGMLVSALYNIVDRIYIGKLPEIGKNAITGLGLTFPIITMILAFSLLIGIGATATISIRLGQQRKDEAERTLGNAFTLVLIFSVILTIVGLIFVDDLLYAFGASEATFGYAKDYIVITLWGTIFSMLTASLNHTIRGAGNPRRAASTMLLGAGLNVILDPIFIYVLDGGVKGAAYATIVCQLISSAWVMHYYLFGNSTLKLRKKYLKLDKKIVLGIFSIGMSPFAMQAAQSFVSIVATKSLKAYGGDMAIGAMTAISSVAVFFLMPIVGINQGFQPIAGYNYGAKNYQRVKDGLRLSVLYATIIAVIGFVAIQLFPALIIKLFNSDPELVEIGSKGIRLYLLLLPTLGFQILCTNFFQNIGNAKTSMFLSLLRQVIILIPLYLILPNFFGLTGIWISVPIADGISFIITIIFITNALKKLK